MNKKVLSAILFGALMAGTGTFTSCIDNEEPASIATLRGAKAELLKAKAAVEQAKVAQVQAEAEVARAQAALLQAQAEAEAAKAESDKALAAAQIAEAQAKAEEALANAEKARLEAEAAYQEAIINLKKAQAQLLAKQQKALAPFVEAYEAATTAYNTAVDKQTKAQRKVTKQLAVIEEKEADKEYFTRELTHEVTLAERELAGTEIALEEAEAELAAAKEMEPHALANKITELDAKVKEINLKIADLSVEAAETMQSYYESGRFKEVSDLYDAYIELTEAEQELPEITIDFADGTGLPFIYGAQTMGKLTIEASTYSDVEKDNYLNLVATLGQMVEEFKSWTRDDDDNLWTAETIGGLEEVTLKQYQERYDNAKKAWSEAVNAYNTGKYNDADETAISGYAEVKDAVTAFNTAIAAYNTAYDAKAAVDTQDADKATYDAAAKAAWEAYDKAVEAAMAAKATALNGLAGTITANTAALKKAWDDAAAEVTRLEGIKTNPQSTVAEIQDAINKLPAATAAATAAEAAYSTYLTTATTVETEAINTAYNKAVNDANKTATDADAAAYKVYSDKWLATNATGVAALNAAKEELVAKLTAAEEACDALKEAAAEYNTNASQNAIYNSDIDDAFEGLLDDTKGYKVKQAIDVEKLVVLNKVALELAIDNRSNALYGTAMWNYNEYSNREARLKEIPTEVIVAKIAEAEPKNMTEYKNECDKYGYEGQLIYIKERIRIAKSWLTNGEIIEALVKQAEDALAEVEAINEAYELSLEEALTAYEEAEAKLEEDAKATIAPIEAKRAELVPLDKLYEAYNHAIADYRAQGENVLTAEIIERYVNFCEGKVVEMKDNVYTAETALMTAQKDLEAWNAGELTKLERLQNKLADANTAVERATTALNEARTQLEAAMAALEWEAAE